MAKVVVLALPDDLDLGEVLHALRRFEPLTGRQVRVFAATEAAARNVLHVVDPTPTGPEGQR